MSTEEMAGKSVEALKDSIGTAELILGIVQSPEDKRAVYGFMVEVQDLIESKLRTPEEFINE